jgi:tripartite ATP-independent transporter DctM subunit
MTPLATGSLALVAIIGLSGLGIPIGIATALTAAIGMYILAGSSFMLVTFQTVPYTTAAEYAFIVVPMFVLMGNIAASAGMIEALFDAISKWLTRARGGLYIAITLASAGFAAVSGSTVVNAAVFSRMVLPQMERLGYHRPTSAGCIAAAGTFAVMIPPSLGFVLYGIMTGESIGKLFIAGMLPGLLTAVSYVGLIAVITRLRPEWAPQGATHFSLREKIRALAPLWSISLLVCLVLGGIYGGIFSPSAAGAIGVSGALAIAMMQRRITTRAFWESLSEASILAGSLLFIVMSGFIFSRFLITSGFVPELTELLTGAGIGNARAGLAGDGDRPRQHRLVRQDQDRRACRRPDRFRLRSQWRLQGRSDSLGAALPLWLCRTRLERGRPARGD